MDRPLVPANCPSPSITPSRRVRPSSHSRSAPGPYTGYPNQIYRHTIPTHPCPRTTPPPPATTGTCIHNSSIMRRNAATQADQARRCRAYEVERAASGDMLAMHPRTYLGRWRVRVCRWILHREPRTALPTSSISLASWSGSEAGHIVWSFRPWMGKGIMALFIRDEWVQGSVLSTSDATLAYLRASHTTEHRTERICFVICASIHPAASRRVVLTSQMPPFPQSHSFSVVFSTRRLAGHGRVLHPEHDLFTHSCADVLVLRRRFLLILSHIELTVVRCS
ncbi:hypothetical protein B0H13DRAFT_2488180 [Mycena leptocephala]|nr:hypothetical protein B0H13DRAFT_2488180 [Mycena leptocephala]